jgi:multiple antibiotic resistance protein
VVVPLAIPLLAGPGAFSTVIVFSFRQEGFIHLLILSGCLTVLGGIVWFALRMANRFMHFLSPLTISIVNKIMGLIMAAIAVEFIANGVKSLFHL